MVQNLTGLANIPHIAYTTGHLSLMGYNQIFHSTHRLMYNLRPLATNGNRTRLPG